MKQIALALVSALSVTTLVHAQETNRTINARKAEQQQRIGRGVQSGQMTAGETTHVEHQERAINREERDMRAADNGHLTHSDRATLQHQQSQESRRIYRDKHNSRVR